MPFSNPHPPRSEIHLDQHRVPWYRVSLQERCNWFRPTGSHTPNINPPVLVASFDVFTVKSGHRPLFFQNRWVVQSCLLFPSLMLVNTKMVSQCCWWNSSIIFTFHCFGGYNPFHFFEPFDGQTSQRIKHNHHPKQILRQAPSSIFRIDISTNATTLPLLAAGL